MLCMGRIWQQKEQEEEEHGTGEGGGSQCAAASSFCDFKGGGGNRTWLSTRKSPQCANLHKDKFVSLKGQNRDAFHCSRDYTKELTLNQNLHLEEKFNITDSFKRL